MADTFVIPIPDKWKKNPATPVNPDERNIPLLFTPLKIRGIELKNRIAVSPMYVESSKPIKSRDLLFESKQNTNWTLPLEN